MAKIVMNKAGDKAGAFNDGDSVYGGAGDQNLLVYTSTPGAAKNVVVGAGVEKVNVQDKATDMSLKYNPLTGYVEVTVNGSIIAKLEPQTDANGTQVATSEGSFFLKMAAGTDGKPVAQISDGKGGTPKTITDGYKPVTADIDAAQKTEIGDTPAPGASETFVLTTGADVSGTSLKNINGTLDNSGNDLFIASMGNAGSTTLNANDRIDGGSGTNTMSITIDSATGPLVPSNNSVKNMQIIGVSGTLSNSGGMTLDAADITGLKTVNINGLTNTGSGAVVLNNMVDAATIGFKGTVTGYDITENAAVRQGYINAGFVAGATTANIALGDLASVAGLALRGTGLTTVNVTGNTAEGGGLALVNGVITAGATASVDASATLSNTVTTLNIDTNTRATLAFFNNDKLTTVNGSTSSGNIELHLDGSLAASGVSIKTGSGNDMVWADINKIKVDTVIDMGAGDKDMFGLTDTAAGSTGVTADAYTAIGKMTGVETIGFFLSDQTAYAIDASQLGGKNIYLDETDSGSGQGAITLSNVAESQTITSSMNHSAIAESLIVTAAAAGTGTPTQGVINIVARDAGDMLNIGNASRFGTLNLSGSGDVTVDLQNSSVTVNGSGMTGKLDVSGSAGADTLIGGANDDLLTSNGGSDTLTGGAGADTFDVALSLAKDASVTGTAFVMATITDAKIGDKVTLIDQGTVTWNATKMTGSHTTLQQWVDAAVAGNGDTNGIVSWFQFAGSTYLVEDMSTDATLNAADLVVKLNGLVDLSGATLASGTFTLA